MYPLQDTAAWVNFKTGLLCVLVEAAATTHTLRDYPGGPWLLSAGLVSSGILAAMVEEAAAIGGPGWTSEDVGVRGCLRAAMPPVEPQAAVPCAVLARVLGWARTRMFESPDGCLHLQVVRGLVGGQCLTAIRLCLRQKTFF